MLSSFRFSFILVAALTLGTTFIANTAYADGGLNNLIVIKDVRVENPQDAKSPNDFGLGKTLVVTLDKDDIKALESNNIAVQKLGLFLGDQFMKGIEPVKSVDGVNADTLRFFLRGTSDNREAWDTLYKKKASGITDGDKVTVAVGFADRSQVGHWNGVLTLVYLPDVMSKFLLGVAIVIVILTIILGWKTAMLRDSGAPRTDNKLGTFSLARVQMALWFGTTVFAFLFIYAVRGDAPTLTQGLLVLMGIGTGAALGAAAIDDSKKTASSADLIKLTAEQQTLQVAVVTLQLQITTLPAADPTIPALQVQLQNAQTRLQAVTAQLAQTATPQVVASENFFRDILTDVNGYSFARLQLFGWTAVFWVLFLSTLFAKITMMEFDGTQLALMGISGSTYLGFKFTEKQT